MLADVNDTTSNELDSDKITSFILTSIYPKINEIVKYLLGIQKFQSFSRSSVIKSRSHQVSTNPPDQSGKLSKTFIIGLLSY